MMKNRTATLIILTILVGLVSRAENYPSRSDFLWVTNPDHPDWLYEVGDSAVISIELYRYGIPVKRYGCEIRIGRRHVAG